MWNCQNSTDRLERVFSKFKKLPGYFNVMHEMKVLLDVRCRK